MATSFFTAMVQVIEKLSSSLRGLNYEASYLELEGFALLILDGMSGTTRVYHGYDHVLGLSTGMDELGTIAALYHDIVYYQVDGGLCPRIEKILSPYFYETNGMLFLKEIEKHDPLFELTLDVFDFKQGQRLLPIEGQNEYLSALVVAKAFEKTLSIEDILQICVCIEATIPFRGEKRPFENLKDRVNAIVTKNQLSLSREGIDRCLERASLLSCNDVISFAHKKVSDFLEDTWRLLPETNWRLVFTQIYSIKEYRLAIYKMESFLSTLRPVQIFYAYNNVPSPNDCLAYQTRAKDNLARGVFFLQLKLLSLGVLEALAELTGGGDIPLIFFMGEVKNRGNGLEKAKENVDYILNDSKKRSNDSDLDPVILDLLDKGRRNETFYDSKSSPISAYLYNALGDLKTRELVLIAKDYFQKKITHKEFLNAFPFEVIQEISKACGQTAFTRQKQLDQIDIKLSSK